MYAWAILTEGTTTEWQSIVMTPCEMALGKYCIGGHGRPWAAVGAWPLLTFGPAGVQGTPEAPRGRAEWSPEVAPMEGVTKGRAVEGYYN